jgi:PAS domain S-box-containing protein
MTLAPSSYAAALCAASGEALVALSHAGEILHWNDGAAAMFGHAADEALGRRIDQLLFDEGDETFAMALDQARAAGSAVITTIARRKDLLDVEIDGILRVEAPEWMSLVARDVTTRGRITRELLGKKWELEVEARRLAAALVQRERLAAIGELAAGISHDLRNPLAALHSGLSLLGKRFAALGLDEPRITQLLEVLRGEVGKCADTISGLLDFARERPVSRTTCAVAPLVADAIRLVTPPPHVSIETELPPELPMIDVDELEIRRVCTNLIQNACESIPAGRPGRVTVRAAADAEMVALVVADDGVGIASEVRERLFDPLFTTKPRGTGLGLAVVSKVIERHGGEVSVESTVGVGSVFTVRLPRARPRNARDTAVPPSAA